MFNSKKTSLFNNTVKTTSASNLFVKSGMKKSAETLSGNGALKYETTGNDFVDQFGQLGLFKLPRSYNDIARDMSILYSQNKETSIKFALYIRMITRKVRLFTDDVTETVPRGTGLIHEGIMRFMWLYFKDKNAFYKHLHLLVSVGKWKDVFYMLSYELQYNGWNDRQLDWDFIGKFILAGLENPTTNNLVKKYLPTIKTNSKCKTLESQANNIIGKWIASLLYGNKYENTGYTYKQYRKLKSTGTAHEWQKLISQHKMLDIDFDTIHGRALAQLVSGKFIENQKLVDKYEKWIESKPIAKFTGFVHELFKTIPNKKYQIDTVNKQFDGLVKTAKTDVDTNTSMIVVRDTSGSMNSPATGTKQSCFDIGKALALFFSEMLPDGYFANNWIEFNRGAKMHEWKGSTPLEKWTNDRSSSVSSTNFQAVFDLFVTIKRNGTSENEFPTGIVCISDGEFNPTGKQRSYYGDEPDMHTNYTIGINKLRKAGFSDEYIHNFKVVLWNLQSNHYGDDTGKKFETYGEADNVFYFSGYDGSVISFLTGTKYQESTPKTDAELFNVAMNQEILNKIL